MVFNKTIRAGPRQGNQGKLKKKNILNAAAERPRRFFELSRVLSIQEVLQYFQLHCTNALIKEMFKLNFNTQN